VDVPHERAFEMDGGANEAVLRMLNAIGSKDKVSEYMKKVQSLMVLARGS
jgi:hypothetical protein